MRRVEGALGARVDAVRRDLVRGSALGATAWVAAGIALVGVLAWVLAGPEGWRAGSPVPLLLDGAVLLWLGTGWWALRRLQRARLDEAGVVRSIERAADLREGEILGPLELSRAMPPGVSSALAERASQQVAERLRLRADAELSGTLGSVVRIWTRRGWAALVGLAVTVATLSVLAPVRASHAWAGLSSPVRILTRSGLPALRVLPGDAEVRRGAHVQIRVDAEGRREVEIRWQAVGDVARTERVQVLDGRAAYVLEAVVAPTEYEVRGEDGSSSPRFRITPVDPLFVSDLRMELSFPPHTGLPTEEYRGAAPALRVPVGTRVTFEGQANRPLATVLLADSIGRPAVELIPEGTAFGGTWTPTDGGRYDWTFRDADGGGPDAVPDPIRIHLTPDAPPLVALSAPGPDTTLASDLRQRVSIEAADDYGLSVLEMTAYRVTARGERREPVTQRFEMGGARLASASPVLDFASWGLMPGDQVRYRVRARDNAPEGQWSETPEHVLRVPSADAMRRDLQDALGTVADRVSELVEAAAAQAEANREEARRRDLGSPRRDGRGGSGGIADPGFEERAELERAVEEQERLEAALDSLGESLGAMQRRMEDAAQADPALRAQMEDLQALLEELGGEELSAASERLSEAVERGDAREAGRTLEELAEEQERLRERLETSLDRFRRAAVEQDFRATLGEAEELARQERALADAMREDGGPLRAEQQTGLADRLASLEDQLERLEERLRELGEPEAADGVREAGARAAEAEASMREASAEASRARTREAAARAEQAAGQMEEAAGALAQAEEEMAQLRMERIRAALERTGDDALGLARRQSEIRSGMRGAGSEALSALRTEEASLAQGVENLAESLIEETEGQVPGGRDILAQMGRAMESIDRTVSSLDRPRSLGGSPAADAERVVGDLNRLALMVFEAAEQMGNSGEGAQQGQGQEQMQEALEDLAQQQGDLVNRAGEIMPLELGEQAMSQQMQRMAQGQQSVAEQLGDLSNQPGSEGALGDLEQMAAEAAELAEALAEGRLDPETTERQERLFHRLLDAGRSLEREDVSEEREAEAPGGFERGSVLPLDEGQLGAVRYRFPDARQLDGVAPGVRRMILDYFERLNRAPVPASGGAGR